MFADDAYLSLSNKNPKVLEKEVNHELSKVMDWLIINKLSLNLKKTTYLTITNRKISHTFNIKIGNYTLTESSEVKYLGVVMDNRLSWKPHLQYVRNKVASGCWALSKIRQFLDKAAMSTIYYGLIYQHLQYCISCWGGAAPSNLLKLATLQKRAVRFICNAPRRAHTNSLFSMLNMLKLEDIYRFQISKIMHKINNNNWFCGFNLIRTETIHKYNTRFSNSYNFFTTSDNLSPKSIHKVGPRVWRKIPNDFKVLNFNLFKKHFRKHITDSYIGNS